MSNLSDLLPAGASAKQLTFTDSGSGISSKAPVVLNSDGTVSAISNTAAGGGTAVNFEAATTEFPAIVYDSANNKMVIFYQDEGNSSYGTAIVGTVSGTSISYGTPVIFNSGTTSYINATYDPDTSQTVTVYKDESNSNYGTAIVGAVSGTSITFGSEAVYASSHVYYNNVTYDTTNDKVVIAYMDYSGSQYGKSLIGTVSGTSISYGSATTFESGSTNYIGICYDSSNDRTVISYQDADDTNKGKAVVGTTSGTSISFGTAVIFESSASISETAAAFDTSVNRVVIAYRLGSTGYVVAGAVSGTSISFGTAVQFVAQAYYGMGIAFDSNAGKTIIPFNNASDTAAYRLVSVASGTTTVTLDSEVAFNAPAQPKYPFVAYNSTEKVDVITFYNNLDNYGYSTVVQVADVTNAQDFVGVADSAISASAAGSIIVQGGTVTGPTASVTIAESLSSAFLYAQDGAADAVGSKASGTGSDNFLIGYEVNDGVARGALAQAATVTSGNISYGSSATIGGASTTVYYYSITYDSTNDKFVVFWRNQSNYYIYAAVVTLTGNSISYGAESAVYSAANYNGTDSFSSTYDPDTDRVILGVCDNGDGYAYSVVIELGTTTIDTVGTPEKIDSASATAGYAKNIALCYDTTENKVIATYVYTGGGGSYYLRVAAGTTTGGATNSITWGSSSVVYSGDADYASIAYNATDQRVVIAYKQIADGKGYSSVATVSGTTVTANTPSAFFTDTLGGTLYYMGIAHDAYVNKMVIYARATQGDAFNGAIDTAANTITWGTGLDVSSDAYNPPQVVFNASTNQTILSGAGTTKATAGSFIYTVPGTVTGQPLTTGTKYYVTTTGAFSSSADTPSVNAGLAISTTSLLLNGDS